MPISRRDLALLAAGAALAAALLVPSVHAQAPAAPTAAPQAAPPTASHRAPRWEHRCVWIKIPGFVSPDEAVAGVNQQLEPLGVEGYELVTMEKSVACFKRYVP